MVSNLTKVNSGQLNMSLKLRQSQRREFWIWSYDTHKIIRWRIGCYGQFVKSLD